MMETTSITVEQVQEVLDEIAFASRYKPEESAKAIDNADLFLKALLSPEVIGDPIAYRIIQHLSTFLKDGLLESDSNVFETIETMYSISSIPEIPAQTKTTLQELAGGLFSHACNALQGNSDLTVNYLKYLLKAMAREGGNRWNAYSCCGPLLMTRLEAFQPHAPLLLEVMLSFPETLSVIHELYQLAPVAFVENLDLLVRLYESNCNSQLSVLDIVYDLAKLHPDKVAPHLAALNRIAQGARNDDVEVLKEIEQACVHSIEEVQPTAIAEVAAEDEEPEDFDKKVDWLNKAAAKCHDLASLREFLRGNEHAIGYLDEVDKVMPFPIAIDYGIHTSESALKVSNGSGSKGSLKTARDSIRTSRDNLQALQRRSRDSKTLLDKDVMHCGLFSIFRRNSYSLEDYVTLKFTCGVGGPHCMTRNHPIAVRANIPPPWLKLATIFFAKSPAPLHVQIKKWHARGDLLDALLEIAQSVEMAASAKTEGGGGRTVDGFEVLSCPFLGTDDLGDLIVDLRNDGLFNALFFNPGANAWACSSCSSNTAQKAKLSGYLVKKGRTFGMDVKRFYMLDERHFFYATTDKAAKPKRQIPISEINSVNQLPENFLEITLKNNQRTIVLRAPSEQQAQRWLLAIREILDHQLKTSR